MSNDGFVDVCLVLCSESLTQGLAHAGLVEAPSGGAGTSVNYVCYIPFDRVSSGMRVLG